jgi:hypothetical protein
MDEIPKKYWKEMWKTARRQVLDDLGVWGERMKIFLGLLIFAGVVQVLIMLGLFSTNQNIPGLLWGFFGSDIFFVLLTTISIPFLTFRRVLNNVAQRDKEQREKLSLKEYEDIDVEYYEYPWTDHQLNLGAGDFINFLKIGLQVRNDGGVKVYCGLRMISVQYNGYASNNDWVPNPNAVEKKLLKWDEGYDVHNGKIELYPDGGIGRILFAESNPYSMEFWFWYVDGRSPNHQLLEGSYKVRIQLEGDSEKDGNKIALKPIKYDILFTYKMRKLIDVSVKKLPIETAKQ